jgi:hypothetical protein
VSKRASKAAVATPKSALAAAPRTKSGAATAAADKTVDPELVRQLAAAPKDQPVQAVFTLKTPAGQPYRDAQATRDTVSRMVDSASTATKAPPARVNVFANAQSFAVSAKPDFVRELIKDQDVASAIANVQQEDMLIRPVGRPAKKPAKRAAATRTRTKR